jgi:hypothetical protein
MSIAESRAAFLMPGLALEDGELCIHSLSKKTELSLPTIGSVLKVLDENDWLRIETRMAHSSGRGGYHNGYRVHPNFWRDVDTVNASLEQNLSEDNIDLYRDTVSARMRIPFGRESYPIHRLDSIAFVGGIAILSAEEAISLHGIWLDGMEGWNSMITIQAAKQLQYKA